MFVGVRLKNGKSFEAGTWDCSSILERSFFLLILMITV